MLQHIETWLGTGKWDVIHFNSGLHDLRYLPSGQRLAPRAEYEENLRKLVGRLKQTGANIIFAMTTPIPERQAERGAKMRKPGDEKIYNAIAIKVMAENGVQINDLHAYALPRLQELQIPDDLHFTDAGSAALAEQVAESIRVTLVIRRKL